MSDLLRSLPSIQEKSKPPPRPGPAIITPATQSTHNPSSPDASSSSSDSSTSTTDSIHTLRPTVSHTSPSSHLPPIPWPTFFAQELHLPHQTPTTSALYHAYLTPPRNPKSGPLFICHHGAGSSAMSFAPFASQIAALMPGAGVLSLSAREHGSLVTSPSSNDEVLDFSAETLTSDALTTIDLVRQNQGWERLPPSVFVGHSLGGVVATRIAADGALGASLVGFQVLDVVEGSAIEALAYMKAYLRGRPERFESVEEAVEWHLRSRTVRERGSAEVSTPGLLKGLEDGGWGWRTDLGRTERWWEGWFAGMSERFLRGRAAKGLVLAGTDRLDRELMVGQMQGKFQLTVIPEAGHFLHEDVPEKMAQLSIEFFKRNDRSAMVLPPKVSDLLAQGKKV
ncbi:protein phosphatase methylesterase [Elsinoe australis]|uniref:Protein phosphatase methylesterase 1 n=1 Tax=Elsinoe australis TaxID=40998 RepID=A0A4U7B2L1_9PEZI|nr:protein phosphatase methylesterase [Elsinoe australis]